LQVELSEELPNCSKNREGFIAEALSEKKTYICKNRRWEYDHDIMDSAKTEDDLTACTEKIEGDSVWVIKESATFICIDRKWEKQEKNSEESESIPTYKSEDNLPNCTDRRSGNLALVDSEAKLCLDGKWTDLGNAYTSGEEMPNCTKKRNGESALVIEDRKVLVCSDGKWNEDKTVEKEIKPSAKSSSSNSNKESAGKSASSSSGKTGKVSSSSAKSNKVSSSSAKLPKSSSAKSDVETTGTMTDSRDGKVYKTIRIGDQLWFAENLNYDDGYAMCPGLDEENCDKYGRLYFFDVGNQKSSVVSVCPEGWHVPDSLEFVEFIEYVDRMNGSEPIGVSLKSISGWYVNGDTVTIKGDSVGLSSIDSTRVGASKGTDRFGFSALPAGRCWRGSGCYVGDDTRFFFMTLSSLVGGGFKLAFDKDEFIYDKNAIFGYISVRCLQNQAVKMDSMPPIVTLDSLKWMAEDVSSDGNTVFSPHEAMAVCPEGWRLPTENEFYMFVISGKSTGLFKDKTNYYSKGSDYIGAKDVYQTVMVDCDEELDACEVVISNSDSERHVRCVSEL